MKLLMWVVFLSVHLLASASQLEESGFKKKEIVTMTDTNNQVYSPEYCALLEEAYGSGMMSEGGKEGVDHMFEGVELKQKRALDIGAGLGGVAFYLAQKHEMRVTGLEINPWMVEESKKRTPENLKERVDFVLNHSSDHLPFPDNHFDIVYSKGVLTHLENKEPLFKECLSILKPGGTLVINDWLSSVQGAWGECIAKLVELENLTLFAESEKRYASLLTKSGFSNLSIRDDSKRYQEYNQSIADTLCAPARREAFLKHYDETILNDSIEGYAAMAQAIKDGELRVLRFIAHKE